MLGAASVFRSSIHMNLYIVYLYYTYYIQLTVICSMRECDKTCNAGNMRFYISILFITVLFIHISTIPNASCLKLK